MKLNHLLVLICLLVGIRNQTYAESIIFEVDMTEMIKQQRFDPTINYVDVAGTFNSWNGSKALTDEDGDRKYQIQIDGISEGEIIEFKFRIDGQWDGREEFPGGGANRTYTVIAGIQTISYWYNDEVPTDGNPIANFSSSGQHIASNSTIIFSNTSAGNTENIQWIFEGAIPTSSSLENPHVRYDNIGSYDVTLIVTGNSTGDTIVKKDYIKVSDRNFDELDWWNESVFYEIFVRSFSDSDGDGIGDFKGLTNKLDYLNDGDPDTDADLGITGIWLMPIHPSPSYHGYDVIDYKSINPDYGSLDDFKTFIDEAHKRGIKVIIDFVMNHSSSEHPWFKEAREDSRDPKRNYYKWATNPIHENGPWGQEVWHQNNPNDYYYGLFWGGMPDLNYENKFLQDEMFDIASFWLSEVGVDGFRLDAIKYLIEEGQELEDTDMTFRFWKDYQSRIKAINPNALSIGEAWTSTNKVLDYVTDGGLDMCFEFDQARAVIEGVKSQNAISIQKELLHKYNVYPHHQYGNFLTNHDMNRVMDELNDIEKVWTAAAIYLTLPGVPFIYYGEEIGMRGSKPDEYIRTPMLWSPSDNAGFTSGNPWIRLNDNWQENNVESLSNDNFSILNWYKILISTRNQYKALSVGEYIPISINNNKVLGYQRHFEGESIIVIINLSDQEQKNISIDGKSAILGNEKYNNVLGLVDEYVFFDSNKRLIIENLGAREVKILKGKINTNTQEQIIAHSLFTISPNPAHSKVLINIDGHLNEKIKYQILNVEGKIILQSMLPHSQTIDISAIKDGVYFIVITKGDQYSTEKLIIAR